MYSKKQFTEKSYNQIVYLLEQAFGLKTSIENLSKKYDTRVFGKFTIGYIAEDEKQQSVAYYGVFPIILNYFGKDFLVAQSGETMTAPSHQKKGLFTLLANETYRKSEEEGIMLIFGFPNENSEPGFRNKLNWVFNGHMQKISIKVHTIPLCELTTKFPFLIRMYLVYANLRLKKNILPLTQKNIIDFECTSSVGLKKDMNYFGYKLRSSQSFLIELNSFRMLIKLESHLKVGVVAYFEKDHLDRFIDTIRSLARKLGCGKIIFLMSENYWLYQYLKNDNNFEKSLPIGFFRINKEIDVTLIDFTLSDYDTF